MPSLSNTLLALATITTLTTGTALFPRAADLTCPQSNGSNYRGPRGGDWTIHCGQDTKSPGSKQVTVQATSFENCIIQCGSEKYDDWCKFAVYTANVNDAGPCYLKEGNGGGYNSVSGTKTAAKVLR